MKKPILVTGGAGFIGSNFVLQWLKTQNTSVINLDKLTYAGNLLNLAAIDASSSHILVREDINNGAVVEALLEKYHPSAVIHFAAESHVDRSIVGPEEFIQTNIHGTFTLLEQSRAFFAKLSERERSEFRFLHVSTDEVYGSLGVSDAAFTEETKYAPNSPYSASKAASDHLVRAYYHTYELPTIITNCSNNYGRFQFPEKLIPLMIFNALNGKPLPVYGDGLNVRDWLYVDDHCNAITLAVRHGKPGETYNIGGCNERTNLQVVKAICNILNDLRPAGSTYESLISHVKDRPGHDRRYAVDSTKIKRELGWQPQETFETGLRKSVEWYLSNQDWVSAVQSGEYRKWIQKQYANEA